MPAACECLGKNKLSIHARSIPAACRNPVPLIQHHPSLFCCRFTCDFYNSLILNPANDNPSCSSYIKIFQGLFTDRESFALAAACLNRWVSRQKSNTNYFHACAASLGNAEGITAWNSCFTLVFFKQFLSSLKRNARSCDLKSCLACYGSSPQNVGCSQCAPSSLRRAGII